MTARIGLTMGDPAGVGPELCLKALEALRSRDDLELVVVVNGWNPDGSTRGPELFDALVGAVRR